jgi:hypothetical protein
MLGYCELKRGLSNVQEVVPASVTCRAKSLRDGLPIHESKPIDYLADCHAFRVGCEQAPCPDLGVAVQSGWPRAEVIW